MGIEIDLTDPEYDQDCLQCWPAGKTPRYVYLLFEGIVKGNQPTALEPPNGHVFSLEQTAAEPCWWYHPPGSFGWWARFYYGPTAILNVMLFDVANHRYFVDQHIGCVPEHEVFTNLQNNPALYFGNGGICTVFWMERAIEVLEDFHIPTDAKILMEFFITPSGQPVYKFCVPKYGMNIKFKLDE